MKTRIIITSLCALLSVGNLAAQQTQETVYLRNGSIIKGEVVEQVPGSSIKVRTADGSIFVYNEEEVERITKEETASPSRKDGRHRGLDFNVDLGYHISTKGGSGMASAEISIGKRFNKHFYWGIGSEVFLPTGDGDPIIPITSDFKIYFPLKSSDIKPGGLLRAGYAINTADNITVGTGKYLTTVEMPDYIMVQIMPTVEIPLSKRIEFNAGLGYTHFIPTKEGGDGSGAFSIRTGFTFHRSPVRKPKKPTRNSGLQLTFEGGMTGFASDDYHGGNFGLALTYKYNPHLNFGIGFGGDIANVGKDNAIRSLEIRNDGNVYGGDSQDLSVDVTTFKLFLRGQYRLNDKRFSPFVSCDAGLRFYSYSNGDTFYGDFYTDNYESTLEYVLGKPKSVAAFLAPSIGVSLRTTNNSYLELKAGYALAPGISGKRGEKEYDTISNLHFIHAASCKPMKMSAPFISLGFTHTFKWGSKWRK